MWVWHINDSKTTIEFELPTRSFVHLTVYNALDQEVATLVDKEVSAGTHKTTWDAGGLPSGIYFVRLEVSFQFSFRIAGLRDGCKMRAFLALPVPAVAAPRVP